MNNDAHLAANIGLYAFGTLRAWLREIKQAFGCRVYVGGSAVRGKGWRDVDVYLTFDDDPYRELTGSLGTGSGRWYALCAAFSAWGTAGVGVPVEVHIMPSRDFDRSVSPNERVEIQ